MTEMALVESGYEFEYNPALVDASEFLQRAGASRFLLVGDPFVEGEGLPEGFEEVAECRHYSEGDSETVALPIGNYRFRTGGGNAVMLVTDGATAGAVSRGNVTEGGASPLERARDWFEHLWMTAELLPLPRFKIRDDVVTVPGAQETYVRSRRYGAGSWSYTVRLDGRSRQFLEGALAALEVEDDPQAWVNGPMGDMRGVAATLTRVKLDEHLTDTIFSFGATRTVFRAYQFRPVIKMLRSGRRRLLIADEVGLGKTIEAGIVWTEFDARREADRVLVVCPSILVEKWRQEMSERFGFEVERLDSERLDDLLEQFETDRVPPRFRAVCSLERLRLWNGLERLNDLTPRFDLIIVDEAHHLRNLGTRSFALGSLLSDWAEILLFLSATPLNLGNDDLFNMLHLLNPGDFDDRYALRTQLEPNALLNWIARSMLDAEVTNAQRRERLHRIRDLRYGSVVTARPEFEELGDLLSQDDELDSPQRARVKRLVVELNTLSSEFTRTRKMEIDEDKTVREALVVDAPMTAAEAALYDAIYEWHLARAASLGTHVHFSGQMPLRLAGSCLQAAKRTILGDRTGRSVEGLVEDYEWDDAESLDDSTHRRGVGIGPLEDGNDDYEFWDEPPNGVIEAARGLGSVDTKFDKFVPSLREIVSEQRRQVLIFTFSRATIAYLFERLAADFRTGQLHGGVLPRERRKLMERFREGDFDVMLATRVASEGLDFEFCGALVNYDLPWNPMEVEQRIGRIDRFGQTEEKIYILNFHTPGTIETDIVSRVHDRIGVFKDSIGDLEPILWSEFASVRRAIFDFKLSTEQRQQQVDEAMDALVNKAEIRSEVEDASDSLSVLDNAEVDGFENEVVRSGRYIGQPELVWLLEDWAATVPGATCDRSAEFGTPLWLHFRGNAALAENLVGVKADRERSESEIAELRHLLQNEQDIHLCLDQETARQQGADLLNANHPLVRAALRAPLAGRTRFGRLRIKTADVPPGEYLVLVALAKWDGIRPATELWTRATNLKCDPVGEAPGIALLAALAEANLQPGHQDFDPWKACHVAECQRQLVEFHRAEEARRKGENERLVNARRISLEESNRRKVRSIEETIRKLQAEGKPSTIPLFESQLRKRGLRYNVALQDLDRKREGSLDLEYVALCALEVTER